MPDGPLSISYDTTSTKTAIPMVKEGEYARFRLVNLTLERGDKGFSTKWEYDLLNPAPDNDGGTIMPGAMGSKLFENIQLYSKEGTKDPSWFMKKICTRMDALIGTGDPDNKKGKPGRPAFFMPGGPEAGINPDTKNLLTGKELVGKMSVANRDGYIGSEFKSVTFPGDIAA